MANKLNGFLDNLVSGALSPKGNLGDFAHAARLYVDDAHRLSPKHKFLYHVSFNLNPEAVIILAGTNDIAGNTGPSSVKMIIDNLMSMAEIACKQNIQVFMSSILPVFRYPWNKSIIEPFKKIAEINNFMKDF